MKHVSCLFKTTSLFSVESVHTPARRTDANRGGAGRGGGADGSVSGLIPAFEAKIARTLARIWGTPAL